MAILNIKQKIEPYVKNATGYIKLLLSSKHVVMENGNDLETTITNLNSEMIEQDDTDYMVYTLCGGKIKVVEGSIIVNATKGVKYVKLLSKGTLAKYFGSDFVSARLNITTFNADSFAQDCRYYAPEFYNGDVYQYFYPASKQGQMRINYRMEYIYPFYASEPGA